MYLMNDASKLSVILYGMTASEYKNLNHILCDCVKQMLESYDVQAPVITAYLGHAGEPVFTGTGTRKQLGALNRSVLETEYMFDDLHDDELVQWRLSEQQNKGIIKNDNGDYVTPKEIVKNLLMKAYGDYQVAYDLDEIAIHMFRDDHSGMRSFLNIRDGSITAVESSGAYYDDDESELGDEWIPIRAEHFAFFNEFNQFIRTIDDEAFLDDIARNGHGTGAIRRIKDMMYNYPAVQEQWYVYRDNVQRDKVERWLKSLGLI